MVVIVCNKCDCVCSSVYFRQNFENWTSGNNDIDNCIQDAQLSAHHDVSEALEWIPYNRFYDITKGGFDKAKWIDGHIVKWNDDDNQNWKRKDQNMFVILKSLNNPASITSKYLKKV